MFDEKGVIATLQVSFGRGDDYFQDKERLKQLFAKVDENKKITKELSKRIKELPLLISFARDHLFGDFAEAYWISVVVDLTLLLYIYWPDELIVDKKETTLDEQEMACKYCLMCLKDELGDYRKWKKSQN